MNNEEKILKILEQQGKALDALQTGQVKLAKTVETIQKDRKSLKKSVSYISKTVNILVRRTDEAEVDLQLRIKRVEKVLDLPPLEHQKH